MDDNLTTRLIPLTFIYKSWDKSNSLTWDTDETQKILDWYIHPKGVSSDYPYEFCCSRVFDYPSEEATEKSWEAYCTDNIGLWAMYAEGAKHYSLTLDNPTDSVFYTTKIASTQTTRELVINECTTSNIRFTLGTLSLTNINITNLWVVTLDSEGKDVEYQFVKDGAMVSSSGVDITCGKENWEINLRVSKNDEGFYSLWIDSGKINADTYGNFNSVLHLKIIADNVGSEVTKTITWTISAIWDKSVFHHYRLYAFPNKYSAHKTISSSISTNGYIIDSSSDFKFNTDSITFSVYLDDDNTGWHQISTDYHYHLVVLDYLGMQVAVINSVGSLELTQTLGSEGLKLIFTNAFGDSNSITSGGSASKSYLVKLYVDDTDYSNATDTYNGNFYFADQIVITFEYTVTEIKQGATGGSVPVSSSLDTSTKQLTLTIGNNTYTIPNVT